MANINSPVAGFTHPGYYSRIIPPSTLTIVAPSLAISTGKWVGTQKGNYAGLLLGGALVIGLAIATWTLM